MNPSVSFEKVSKKYRLGSSNTSLREALANSVTSRFGRRPGGAIHNEAIWALRNISFEVPRGEALGLIGPNGAGKTTILKILARVTQPTQGEFEVRGRTSALIELGAGFHPDLTGRENIYLNAAILGLSRREVDRLFDRIVDFSGLEPFIDTPVKRYSSGMYVRLGFSVAAHVEPDVLLVDEVLAVGDAQFRQKCAKRIDQLRESGTSIVFVGHNLYLVRSICESALFLAEGKVQKQGDVVSVIRGYEEWLHGQQTLPSGPGRFEIDERLEDDVTLDITQVEILNAQPDGSMQGFSSNDPLDLHVHYVATQPLRNPNLVVRIVRADGTTCCMIRTADHGFTLDSLDGTGVISLTIDPLQLTSGTYTIDARITGFLDGLPLAQAHADWFRVIGAGLSNDGSRGVYVPQVAKAEVIAAGTPIHT